MRTIESSGKTVEEALSSGLKQLGVDISAVTHEVLDKGSPGLFGMFGRLAKVRITVTEEPEEDKDFDIELPTLSIAPEQKKAKDKKEKKDAPKAEKNDKKDTPKNDKNARKPEAPKAEKQLAPKAEKTEQPEEPKAAADATAENEEEKPQRPRREKSRRDKKPKVQTEQAEPETGAAPAAPVREFPPLDVEKLSEDGKKAYEFIAGMTRLMQVDVDIRMLEEENQIFVDISGDTLGILIGRRGDTLDALQYLTSLTVNKEREEYIRVTIDVEHYRAKREETLRKLAVRMANRARKSGRRVVLEPMNPYERRVLHSTLQNDPYVQTHSEGEEPYRRVIITLK